MAAVLEYAPWLVCADGRGPRGPVLGYAYASRHRDRAAYQWSVDVSVYVHETARRKGIGRALYTSLFALLHLQGFCAAHAGITLPNEASVGVHECLGFRPVGVYPSVGFKLGAWRDVGWWQLPLRERQGEPAPPLSFAAVLRLPGFAAALAEPSPLPGGAEAAGVVRGRQLFFDVMTETPVTACSTSLLLQWGQATSWCSYSSSLMTRVNSLLHLRQRNSYSGIVDSWLARETPALSCNLCPECRAVNGPRALCPPANPAPG